MSTYLNMQASEMLAAVADDASKWADAFREAYPDVPHDVAVGWFANAIESSHDLRISRLVRDDQAWLSFQGQVFQRRGQWAALTSSEVE